METGKPETIDEYNAGFPPEKRAILEKIRATFRTGDRPRGEPQT